MGATHAYPGLFPDSFESIGLRTRSQHDFGGTIFTRPSENVIAVGVVSRDRVTGGHKEDMRTVDLRRRELSQPTPDEWSRAHPEYGHAWHHGQKPFFHPISDLI